MSRFYLLPLICAFFVLPLLTSCEQEASEQIQFEQKTGAAYLASYFTPPILFHYSFADETNSLYTGWFIDDEGTVRSYQLDYQPFRPDAFEIQKDRMEKVISQSEVLDIEVDLEMLVENYKKTINVAKADFKTISENPDLETTSTYYAYSLSYGRDEESCGARSHNSLFRQVTLEYEGKTTVKNESHLTQGLIDWMKQIQDNQGL